MNLVKSRDYFNPINVNQRCHIIGCGSVGSTVAELLVRLGLTKISLYDFDVVSSHNLANQMFNHSDNDGDPCIPPAAEHCTSLQACGADERRPHAAG